MASGPFVRSACVVRAFAQVWVRRATHMLAHRVSSRNQRAVSTSQTFKVRFIALERPLMGDRNVVERSDRRRNDHPSLSGQKQESASESSVSQMPTLTKVFLEAPPQVDEQTLIAPV